MIEIIKQDNNMKKDAAFLIIHSKDGFYKERCRVLFSWRFDSTIGFVGGEIDEGETPKEAMIRECFEETGYQLNVSDLNDLVKISEKKTSFGSTNYCFSLEVDKEVLLAIAKSSHEAKDFNFESCGFNSFMLYDQALENIVKFPFSGTCKEEFELFLNKINFKHSSKSLKELFSN